MRRAQAEAAAWAETSTDTATCTRLHARTAKELGDATVKPLQLIPLSRCPSVLQPVPPYGSMQLPTCSPSISVQCRVLGLPRVLSMQGRDWLVPAGE